MKKLTLLLIVTAFILTNCGIYKRSDVKDNPVNVDARVRKNIEEGRGIRFGKGSSQGGIFDFASSNELWRASIDILDFVPFTNVSYSGGIIITDWFSGNSKVENEIKLAILKKAAILEKQGIKKTVKRKREKTGKARDITFDNK